MIHENTSKVVLLNLTPVLSIKMKSPNANAVIIQTNGISNTVEYINCFFNWPSTSIFWVIYYPSVINELTIIEAIIPMAGINKTNKKVEKLATPSESTIEFPPMTKAAQVD